MIDIVKFYFDCIAKVITDVWGSFEIFEGINYGYWVIGVLLFCLILKVVTFGYSYNGISNIKGYQERKNKQYESRGGK